MRPLDGITVVSLEHAIAAPFATRQLADQGARVIKVERPEGDFARNYDDRVNGLSSHFVWTNRSKESLALNLKKPAALNAVTELIARADVFVQNLAPGAASRMGLSYSALSAKNPRLIVCNISGYGDDGPDRDRKAYDLLVQAEAGFLSVTGTADTPSKAGCSVADIAAGMYAYSNILTAIIRRGQTDKGCEIDISMLEAMAEWMGFPMYYAYDGQTPPSRGGGRHASIYPYGPFATGDGETVLMGIQNEREWVVFCRDILHRPDLSSDTRFDSNSKRVSQIALLQPVIETALAALSAAELTKKLDRAGIANARMNDMAGLWDHPQLQGRNRWRDVESPAGSLPALLPPGRVSGFEPRMDPIPEIGAHSREILAELGLKPDEIDTVLSD